MRSSTSPGARQTLALNGFAEAEMAKAGTGDLSDTPIRHGSKPHCLLPTLWAIDPDEENGDVVRLDGARWVIEGSRREIYRVVRRDGPRGPLHDHGRAFLDVAGPP